MTLSTSFLTKLLIEPKFSTSLTLQQWELVLLVYRDANMLGKLSHTLSSNKVLNQLPNYARHHLANAAAIATKQQQQMTYEAQELLKVTTRFSGYSIFLKGAAYSLCNNQAGAGRIYSDVDLAVEKPALDKIEPSLATMGWLAKETDEYDQNYYRKWAHEIPPMQHANRGTVLDLHHNLVPPMSGRANKIQVIINSKVALNDKLFVLSPAAMTLHSAIHLFFNEEFEKGFRDLHDLHCLFSQYNSDDYWHKLIQLAQDSDFTIELFLATRYSYRVFNTHIPAWLSQQLKAQLTRWQRVKLTYWDYIFDRVLYPHHKHSQVSQQKLAIILALVRGHLLKMPLPLLCKHTLHKGYKALVEAIMGSTFFSKEDKDWQK